MARSSLTNTNIEDGSDNGSVLLSIIDGEQLQRQVTIGWVTNLTSYNIHIRIIEAMNDGAGSLPTEIKAGGVKRLLTTASGHIHSISGNKFKFVVPWDIAKNFSPRPAPSAPSYAFFELEVGEPGTGDGTDPIGNAAPITSQVWKPLRGLLAVNYSPTED